MHPHLRTSIEVLNGDINKLDAQVRKISKQLENSNTEPDVVAQMDEFLPVSIRLVDLDAGDDSSCVESWLVPTNFS